MKEGIDGELRLSYFVSSAEGGEGTDGGKGWQRGRKEKRGGVGVMTEVLGDFLPLKFPGACTTALCVCVCMLRFGVMGTCKVTSLRVLSLGRGYCLLPGCVASSQPYYC